MTKSITKKDKEKLFIQAEVEIAVSPIERTIMFEGYVVLSDKEIDRIKDFIFTKDEQRQLHKVNPLYEDMGEWSLSNAVNDAFYEIVEGTATSKGYYEFD